jgi:hypothetical protein
MNECLICYDMANLIFLPCSHSLCSECKHRLVKPACPFCRSAFEEASTKVAGIINTLPRENLERFISRQIKVYQHVPRIRVRRRRRKTQTTSDFIDSDYGSIIIEHSQRDENYTKRRVNNKKRASWSKGVAHQRTLR